MGSPPTAATDFDDFLREALPELGLCPSAHRRRNIRRRLVRRMETLGIHEFARYLDVVRRDPVEAGILRSLLAVTISRFFRNRRMWDTLSEKVLRPLAEGGREAAAWSAGCASGEEPYSLAIAWRELPGTAPLLRIVATDIDEASLARASKGVYAGSSLREMPRELGAKYFAKEGDSFRIAEDVKRSVRFRRRDLQAEDPPGEFALILCRNAAFTYLDPPSRIKAAAGFAAALGPGGHLVIGRTETLPPGAEDRFAPAFPAEKIYRATGGRPSSSHVS